MRTIPEIAGYLQPLEDSIRNHFIYSLLGEIPKDPTRDLLALPARLGGMVITNPVKIAQQEYLNSKRLTGPLTKLIVEQDRDSNVDMTLIRKMKREIQSNRNN